MSVNTAATYRSIECHKAPMCRLVSRAIIFFTNPLRTPNSTAHDHGVALCTKEAGDVESATAWGAFHPRRGPRGVSAVAKGPGAPVLSGRRASAQLRARPADRTALGR